MSGQCPSCGLLLSAPVRHGAHCPRCGGPLPVSDDPEAPAAPPPEDDPTVTAAPADEGSVIPTANPWTQPTPNRTRIPGVDVPAAPEPAGASRSPVLPSIPGYEVLEVIGRGGMGVVYKARQLTPRRIVALKMILGGGGAARFRTEVAAVARLQHPNVVQIHEVSEVGGRAFFAMEYVPGGSLAAHLQTGPVPTRTAAEIVVPLARAVQHAHERGIVHRDLKPANILLAQTEPAKGSAPDGDGSDSAALRPAVPLPKIADFGLAKYLEGAGEGSGPQTQSGAILGTPNYMAPEQAKGRVKAIGPHTDIWALGAILYECLTGRPPFREDSPLDTLMKVISEAPTAPRQLRGAVPRDLEVICLKCLRKEPGERYATAGALADDLERFLDGRPIAARAQTVRERVRGWARRRREFLFLAAAAMLVVGAGLVALIWLPRPPAGRPAPDPDPGANLPPDLQLVPPNAFLFATVRAADLWNNPALGELHEHMVQIRALRDSLDKLAQSIERETTLHPTNIERVTFVVENEGARGPVYILFTVRPYSRDEFHTARVNGRQHLPQTTGDRTVYIPAQRTDNAFLPISDRVLVMGETEAVWALATRTAGERGALTPVLERAAAGHTVVVGIRPTRGLTREVLSRIGLQPRPEPVLALDAVELTADVSAPTGPNGTVRLDLTASVPFPTAEQAEEARPHLPAVVRAMLAQTATDSDFRIITRALEPLFAAVRATPWERDRDTLRARVQVGVELAEVKAGLSEGMRQGQDVSNMWAIARALQQYHNKHGRYPPAVVTDADGRPLYSWRVLILPYLNESDLYRRFHLNRAWDHPTNRPLLDRMPAVFAPAGAEPRGSVTHYQVLTGAGGLFDTPDGRRQTDITDGVANTILFVEAAEPVAWTRPLDVTYADPARPPALGRPQMPAFGLAFAGGAARLVPHEALTPARLRGLFTRAGGERVTPP